MDSLLTEIKTVKNVQSNIEKFESLSVDDSTKSRSNSTKSKRSLIDITPSNSSDTANAPFDLEPSIRSSQTSVAAKPATKKQRRHDSIAFLQKSYLQKPAPSSLPDDAREILLNQPDQEDLVAVLQYLHYGIQGKHDFDIHIVSPNAAQILNVLVTVTIPDQWHVLKQRKLPKTELKLKELLISSLRSVAGIGALLMQIRHLTANKANNLLLEDILSVLEHVLRGSELVRSFLQDAHRLYAKLSQRRVLWQEIVSILCGSKVLSTTSQAFVALGNLEFHESRWLSDGNEYSAWLARNIAACAISLNSEDSESWTMLSLLMKRALNLGYRESFISSLYSFLLLGTRALWTPLHRLLQGLSDNDQRTFFDGFLRDLVRKYLRSGSLREVGPDNNLESEAAMGGVAGMVAGLVHENPVLEQHLENWLTTNTGEYASLGLDTRRAVVATLGLRKDTLQRILERCLESFGDKIQIQHSPILQQQSMVEIILLTIGYVYRLDSDAIKKISKSGLFLRSVSNRLAASVPRARFLGMAMAVGVSRLVDPPDKVMDFGSEEMKGEDAQKLLGLVHVKDEIGKIEALREKPRAGEAISAKKAAQPEVKITKKKGPQMQTSKVIAIEEITDEDDEDDLVPFQKPDEDPSDSDEDPTLINRSKPSAPVYIIDLVKQLQTDDKPDVVALALRTAPDLIRRKANFGSEVSDNVQVVASSLINLKDGMLDRTLQDLRLQSLIACVVSKPSIIGPWLSSMYFEGDFSLSQRATMLTTMGLGARELSGHKDEVSALDESSFPSRQLPPHLAAVYAPTDTVARQIEHSTFRPLALAAADKLSGPDVLKVRTFSSRLEVQRKKEQKQMERSKRIPKDLHQLLAESFYLPLCCRMSLLLSSNVSMTRSSIFEANIIRLFLQTLTIIIACLGPNAVQLENVTRETLLLLVALHNSPALAYDPVVLPTLLQLLLTTLDLNVEAGRAAEERLVTAFGSMMAELITWAGGLSEGGIRVPVIEGEGEAMGMPWTVLVAGIQVKWHEVGRKFQGRMLGLMGADLDGALS